MKTLDPVVALELPVIERIIADEVWRESQRRGQGVSRHDPVVVENVCAIILRIGKQLRASCPCAPVAEALAASPRWAT